MADTNARALRKSTTEAETVLWSRLRQRRIGGFRFRRQAPIGRFIADFACFEARLVIEVDGGQHTERAEQDAARTRWLESQGFRVLRFWNNQVLREIEGVEEVILRELTGKGR